MLLVVAAVVVSIATTIVEVADMEADAMTIVAALVTTHTIVVNMAADVTVTKDTDLAISIVMQALLAMTATAAVVTTDAVVVAVAAVTTIVAMIVVDMMPHPVGMNLGNLTLVVEIIAPARIGTAADRCGFCLFRGLSLPQAKCGSLVSTLNFILTLPRWTHKLQCLFRSHSCIPKACSLCLIEDVSIIRRVR